MGLVDHAPAKINLALHVTGRRGDGYHLLDSLVVFTELGDRLTLDEDPATPGLELAGPFGAPLQAERANLVTDAADAFMRETGADLSALSFVLEKNLPVASGIGGGSSDCAAALRLLNQYFGYRLGAARLAQIGLTLGADVPVCLAGQSCRMTGIGETLAPVTLPPLHLVLVNPGREVPTGGVFQALKGRFGDPMDGAPPAGFAAFAEWLSGQRNDLETPAMSLCPDIAAVKEALEASDGCALARMSGSGATLFGLYETAEAAAQATERLHHAYPGWWVAQTRSL